jgi:uncharacterized Zn finger protein
MTIPPINEKSIRLNSTNSSYQRGQDYYDQGAVIFLWQRGQTLQALVQGSEVKPYRVNVDCTEKSITNVSCTCPCNYEGWCKHIVAVLLTCCRQPQLIATRPSLEDLLTPINETQLRALLKHLVDKTPENIETIESFLRPAAASNSLLSNTINAKAYRNIVRNELKQSLRAIEEDYSEEDPISDEIYDLVDEAKDYSQRGETVNAIAILEAIVTACAEEWDDLEEYGADNDDLVKKINKVLTEAILTTEFNDQERKELAQKIEQWQDEWSANFQMSIEAVKQGWNQPALVKILQGEIPDSDLEIGFVPDYMETLNSIRLQILENQDKDSEYLNLALASGKIVEYLAKLVYLDRISEAMEAAKTVMTKAEEAFFFAKALRDENAPQEALTVARRGLTLPGKSHYELALWTSQLAEYLEDNDTALTARVKSFQAQPSLLHYQKIESLAGEDWPDLKLDLLDYLRQYTSWRSTAAKVDIFLQEGLVTDAIESVSNTNSLNTNYR